MKIIGLEGLYLNFTKPNSIGFTSPAFLSQPSSFSSALSSERRTTEISVSISDSAKYALNAERVEQSQLDHKRAIGTYIGELLHGLNAHKLKNGSRADEDLSIIERQIKRIQKQLQKLKEELRAIAGDNSKNAKLERRIIQDQIMLLTVQIVSLLERKMRAANV
ncbi:hypothetical protein FM037_05075 [Shewanella psychropiezotolerans]|uniref:Uncharacterized protein n=1 Tax=Shewanella psychropiezotolerans TaxID=2593655 RepID=A0ABX5WUG1_9GAMM|nr:MULTISPECIES: FlxA-like family protein [Shewanella]MPY23065.1 hypothetical protein [Shewanella sp. YLB-07]QDO82721.1 hypothetical protein FM037_05075 [Shewanella psychropiezotolerans]